jgi:hypothetical protein
MLATVCASHCVCKQQPLLPEVELPLTCCWLPLLRLCRAVGGWHWAGGGQAAAAGMATVLPARVACSPPAGAQQAATSQAVASSAAGVI